MRRDRHPARGTPWLFRCPEGHASVELFATTFRCIACQQSYSKDELVRVLDERRRQDDDGGAASEALGVRLDGGEGRTKIEGPFPEVDEYGRLTGRYFRCAGCGVEAMTVAMVQRACECDAGDSEV